MPVTSTLCTKPLFQESRVTSWKRFNVTNVRLERQKMELPPTGAVPPTVIAEVFDESRFASWRRQKSNAVVLPPCSSWLSATMTDVGDQR